MTVGFTVIAAIIGFIPGGHFLLIPLEVFLVYSIAKSHNAFNFFEFIVIAGVLCAATTVLGGLASLLHVIPILGQFANSFVAAGVMWAIGSMADEYYGKK